MLRIAEFHCSGAAVLGARWGNQIPVAALVADDAEKYVVQANFPKIMTINNLCYLPIRRFPNFAVAWIGAIPDGDMSDILKVIDSARPRAILHVVRTTVGSKTLVEELTKNREYTKYDDKYSASSFGLPQYSTRSVTLFLKNDVRVSGYFHWPDGPPLQGTPDIKMFLDPQNQPHSKFWLTEKQIGRLETKNEYNRKIHIVREGLLPQVPLNYGKHCNALLDCDGLRRLSPREVAIAQGFPNDWKLPKSKMKAYKILGKAPWPQLVAAILRELDEWLF